jgi:hypothetical protein
VVVPCEIKRTVLLEIWTAVEAVMLVLENRISTSELETVMEFEEEEPVIVTVETVEELVLLQVSFWLEIVTDADAMLHEVMKMIENGGFRIVRIWDVRCRVVLSGEGVFGVGL